MVKAVKHRPIHAFNDHSIHENRWRSEDAGWCIEVDDEFQTQISVLVWIKMCTNSGHDTLLYRNMINVRIAR